MMLRQAKTTAAMAPLLQIYRSVGIPTVAQMYSINGLGKRFRAVVEAKDTFLNLNFLESACDSALLRHLEEFHRSVLQSSLGIERLSQRIGIVRHTLIHLLACPDSWPAKFSRVMCVDGSYFIPGIGPDFWSAVFQALEFTSYPALLPGVFKGLKRMGLIKIDRADANNHTAIWRVYQQLLHQNQDLSFFHLDHLFLLIASMRGRDLWSNKDELDRLFLRQPIATILRDIRACGQSRQHIKGWPIENLNVCSLQESSDVIANACDKHIRYEHVVDVHSIDDRELSKISRNLCSQSPKFIPWQCDWHEAVMSLCPTASWQPQGKLAQYVRYNSLCQQLLDDFQVQPHETIPLLQELSKPCSNPEVLEDEQYFGFTPSTFHFLHQHANQVDSTWLDENRDRYRFVLRQPLVQLAKTLIQNYVHPVLNKRFRLDLQTDLRSPRVLNKLLRNKNPSSGNDLFLIFQKEPSAETDAADQPQFFVRLASNGLSCGIRIPREAKITRRRMLTNLEDLAAELWEGLVQRGAIQNGLFAHSNDVRNGSRIRNLSELGEWMRGKHLTVGFHYPPDDAILSDEALAGEIMLQWERLRPIFHFACLDAPTDSFNARPLNGFRFTTSDFTKTTHLDANWLQQCRNLLETNKQLILQGVPGTGKTFVASSLAQWFAGDEPHSVLRVQFHPAFTYEEFVEGIRPSSTAGQSQFAVENGILLNFAERASANPASPHVLIIDEINRANLPRVMGELLFLLEYRDASITLPYSRRQWRLPRNLYVIATMNPLDRSITAMDLALRRRFSFVTMAPDRRILDHWHQHHSPEMPSSFRNYTLSLFSKLNQKLGKEMGESYQIGHSYFMIANLDHSKLNALWNAQIMPLIRDFCLITRRDHQEYTLDRLQSPHQRTQRSKAATARLETVKDAN